MNTTEANAQINVDKLYYIVEVSSSLVGFKNPTASIDSRCGIITSPEAAAARIKQLQRTDELMGYYGNTYEIFDSKEAADARRDALNRANAIEVAEWRNKVYGEPVPAHLAKVS